LMARYKRNWHKYFRLAIIVILALVVALATSEFNKRYIESKVSLVKIVVAAEHIKPFTELTSHNLTYREVVKSEVPQDAIFDIDEFLKEGPMFVGEVGFIKGYPVKKALTNNSVESVFGAAVALKEGKSYLGISVEQVSSQLVKPGTLVDAYCFIQASTVNADAYVISKVEDPLLGRLYVHAVKDKNNVDLDAGENQDSIPSIVVVETLSPEQTSKLIYYQMVGKLFLVPVGADVNKYLETTDKMW
jgi:Flp pilus assembly protein CpaB